MKQFNQRVIDAVKQLDSNIKITEATGNADRGGAFKEEGNYQSFTDKNVNGIQFSVSQDNRERFVTKLQNLLNDDFIVYFSEQHFGHQPDEITVLESSDKYDALRFEGCNGVNYGVHPEDIICYLEELEKTNPFILTGVGFDFVQGNFLSPPSNVEGLAQSMYEFCPDIVDQGTEDIEGLIEELKNSNSFYFWWD